MSLTINEQIEETIDLYFSGLQRQDMLKIKHAFHPDAHVYFVEGNKVKVLDVEALCNLVSIYGAMGCECRILDMDIMGSTASAKFEIAYPFATYKGVMSLLSYDGHWFIVNKTYSWAMDPEEASMIGGY